MITSETFQYQLQHVLVPLLRRWSRCYRLNIAPKDRVTAFVSQPFKPNHFLEIQIQYSSIYQEPQLTFRIWEIYTVDDVEYQRPCFPTDLSHWLNMQEFTVRLDYLHPSDRNVWYSVHGCDTAETVGSQLDHYLQRWASVYFTIFDFEFSRVFV
ncbi:LAME_0H17018g1_1 [Lachancea meyersii CBS 8951]|uniref:LAME_0H17018g1_1 n=1 Tax=Lachancea meyersii CBS 8951 TaxID=1266667 RepID=A0A1G4KIG2_9SACH|nr:LAME_0H17018g1_1 [Lachancea meyersii CBS 8951]